MPRPRQPHLVLADSLSRRDVATFRPRLDIVDALGLMLEHGWTNALVTDDDGKLAGVFTETDARRVLAQSAFYSLPAGTIGDHMTRDVVSIDVHADIFQVVDAMRQYTLRTLPVVEGDHLVGVITTHDVDAALWRMIREREQIELPKPPPGAAWDPRISAERDRRGR